jgi:hypothetical protein
MGRAYLRVHSIETAVNGLRKRVFFAFRKHVFIIQEAKTTAAEG